MSDLTPTELALVRRLLNAVRPALTADDRELLDSIVENYIDAVATVH